MRTLVKVSSKSAKNSTRAAQEIYHYGKALLFGYFEITKRFAHGQEAIDWLNKVQSGWRSRIYDAYVYYDQYAVKPMLQGEDAYKFAQAKRQFGSREALRLAREGAFSVG